MATIDLINLLFIEILKIDSSILYKYVTLSDQVLYLFLIPHVILFLFLYAFAFGIVSRVVGQHKGFSYLVGIVSYIYVIYAGWYGKLVTLFLGWLYIALGLALFLFFVSIIWHPAATTAGMKLMGEIGKDIGKKAGRGKQIEELEDELKFVRKRMKDLKDTREANPAAAYEYENYKRQEEALKNAIKKLGG
jgi:hypothetical protein